MAGRGSRGVASGNGTAASADPRMGLARGSDGLSIRLGDAKLLDGTVSFGRCKFAGSTVTFHGAELSGSEPGTVLARMRQLARPGGRIVLEDTDMSGCYCHPHDPANARFVELYTEVVRRGGGDADLGRRLPAVALAAGLGDVRWNVFQPVHASGPHKHMTAVTMERIRPAVLHHGLATNEEVDSVIGGMHAFAEDSTTLVGMPRMVQVWGTA